MTDLLVAIFGFWGGVARLYGTQLLGSPWNTLLINLLGAFLLPLWNNFFGTRLVKNRKWLLVGVGTGFFGAFTTFSSFCLDFVKLMMADRQVTAILYLIISMIGGILAAWLGTTLAQRLEMKVMDF
ncbi:fluoride efflux transporter FluC [Lapidilactobacillus mulanensis]|uniref:Fluoride-specific ion channel FluC n=1 Tax=Lapidilactobacillus mulanensis TaxID=2485999 RepID=A0ABW4DRR0_9LACO|nr:CrcB family protein [Lapidilactobacillus mulanensis]